MTELNRNQNWDRERHPEGPAQRLQYPRLDPKPPPKRAIQLLEMEALAPGSSTAVVNGREVVTLKGESPPKKRRRP